jgi:two-component system CheB/CheR fusion protein
MTTSDDDTATAKALERSEAGLERLRYALDQASIIAVTDVSGRITYANEKFCEISKYSAEELIGQDHRIINSGYHSKDFFRQMWRTIAKGGVWRGELRNRAKDGAFYWVDTTIVPLLDERGKPKQYLAIRNDITEKKRIEAQLRAQDTMAQLGQMATVIAHEVRNPLAGISATIQVIAPRLPKDSREAVVLKDVIARIGSLDEVVSGLLDFARPRPLKIRDCSAREIAERAALLFRDHPQHRSVRFEISGRDVRLQADAETIGRALLNLLVNAVQAVESRPPRADGTRGKVAVEIGEDESDVLISVVDDGPGIAEEIAETLFRPFVTTKVSGTGLGLPIVKQAVENHGGTIEAVSEAGRTRFTLHLPKSGPSGA